ncbi:MAG: GNAT family N-acetyltransferase [Gemmatimonadetes bacterium]|nr:GNAT family N-acetyltransferase [Gemmatimonadota bacterium]
MPAPAERDAVPPATGYQIRRLVETDAAEFQALRLLGLQESSQAFAASYEEEADTPMSAIAERLADPEAAVFGAFDPALIGVVGVYRQAKAKMRHHGHIWGMYVHPAARRRGVGRALVLEAVDFAATALRLRYLTLGVNVANRAAIDLYRSIGFVPIGVERDFLVVDGLFQDELHMRCDLPQGPGPSR